MRKLIILFLALSSPAFAQREAYVVNSLAETLSRIDLETGIVTNHIVTLNDTPNQVVYNSDYLYVVNSVSADVMKINALTHQVEFTFLLPVGSNPYNVTIDGEYAYVTGWVSGKVYRLNLTNNSIDGEVDIGGYPEGLMCHNDYLYVTQTYFDPNTFSYGQGKLAKIDLNGFSFVADFNVGKNPQWISRAPDGNLHVVCTGNYVDIEGSIYIFDPGTDIVSDSVLIGGQPGQLAISPAGIGYLSAGGWTSNGFVYSYDVFGGNILRGPSNPIMVGLGASAIDCDSIGYVYSCDFGDDTVSKIDFSGNVIGTFALGDGPQSIAIIDDTAIGVEDEGSLSPPENAYLINSYPNPFNAGTIIKFQSGNSESRPEYIEIFDIAGRSIKTIMAETLSGYSEVYWNGTDNVNNDCASGIYFARIVFENGETGGPKRANTLKMTLIR